ncbi:hypothetical protein HRH25_21940 [Flavisolibacter sp. BT320]|nr:hypothetical protein [Flavisolibacter longurius]
MIQLNILPVSGHRLPPLLPLSDSNARLYGNCTGCDHPIPLNLNQEKGSLSMILLLSHQRNKMIKLDGISIYSAIQGLEEMSLPGIVVKGEVLKSADDEEGGDPTLFVRLNSSGTRIAGEELMYSIYKASFPEAKQLVEKISANFIAPSTVISLVARLTFASMNNGHYPVPMSVNEFRKRIQDADFKLGLRQLIGSDSDSPAENIFSKAFTILRSKADFAVPPVLLKSLVKSSSELFLLLLRWVQINDHEPTSEERKRILAAFTALTWFGRDNAKYVRKIWPSLVERDFWSREILSFPYRNSPEYIMYPLVSPDALRNYLQQAVVSDSKFVLWGDVRPEDNGPVMKEIATLFTTEGDVLERINIAREIWGTFRSKLFWNRSLLLFAQRHYLNGTFPEFNQMGELEDTNRPWDWDHIYPESWVYYQQNINLNTRHWTWTIGNFRALSLEENRREGNIYSPSKRLVDEERKIDVREDSFVKENSDWAFWSKIDRRVNDGDTEMIEAHLAAVVTRLCNVYEEWYNVLDVGELFSFIGETP